jgi:hypothetical protein
MKITRTVKPDTLRLPSHLYGKRKINSIKEDELKIAFDFLAGEKGLFLIVIFN